jgi:hypothetical protein
MRHGTFCVLGLVLGILAADSVCSAAELFSNSTDTISIAGNTVVSDQATFEATVEFTSTSYIGGFYSNNSPGSGVIFNAWQSAEEDEALAILDGGIAFGSAVPLNFPIGLYGGSLTTGEWYDIAWDYDGSQQRLYVNGTLVASTEVSGAITTGSDAIAAVGAIYRDGSINQSFLGEIQSLRISDASLYSGNSYSATLGDFSDNSSTVLLYDFDNPPSGQTVTDLSGNGHTGTLGTGFVGATSPTFVSVPEPTTTVLLGAVAGVCCLRRHKRQRCPQSR